MDRDRHFQKVVSPAGERHEKNFSWKCICLSATSSKKFRQLAYTRNFTFQQPRRASAFENCQNPALSNPAFNKRVIPWLSINPPPCDRPLSISFHLDHLIPWIRAAGTQGLTPTHTGWFQEWSRARAQTLIKYIMTHEILHVESSRVKAGTEAREKEFPNSPTSPFTALSVVPHIPQSFQLEENPSKMHRVTSTPRSAKWFTMTQDLVQRRRGAKTQWGKFGNHSSQPAAGWDQSPLAWARMCLGITSAQAFLGF